MPKKRLSSQGFTLLELAIYLVVAGLMTVTLFQSFQGLKEAGNRDRTGILMKQAEIAVIDFALGNNRLPCPDSNSDGQEDCSASLGTVPFQSVGLDGQVLDANNQPISYGIYRNAGANADLGVLTELKNEINGLDILDRLDFCEALANAQTAAASSGLLSVSTNPQGTNCAAFTNIGFILVSGSNKDADHVSPSSRFDQENSSNPALCFASPQKPISAQYDDLLTAISFSKLFEVACGYQ